MPIHISKTLIAKLPPAERADIEDVLWEKSKQHCFLCEDPLHRASDVIEADHDIPEADGGLTEIANLNLVHGDCNKAKRNAKSIPIRPYLRLKAYLRKNGTLLQYDGVQPHFGIAPSESALTVADATVHFELPHGQSSTVQIYSETNLAGSFRYVYVELPKDALFNDDRVQPRTIKDGHVLKIYADLQHNPLNEPPSARIDGPFARCKIKMFDGQHKTIANWMMGRGSIVAKVYLDMTEQQATRLVNSIQSGVPKLSLSPFELAAKMDQEWRARLEEYEQAVGPEEASEAGFFKWLPQMERARGRKAFREALLQNQLDNPDLRIREYVRRTGEKAPATGLAINEATLKSRVLPRLIRMEPLDLKGDAFVTYRAIETDNIIHVLNMLTDLMLEPAEGENELPPARSQAAKRMLYQSSLGYLADMLHKLFRQHTLMDELGLVRPSDDQKAALQQSIERLVNHPVWNEPFTRDAHMEAVKNALEKNQEARKAFEGIALDLPYAILGDQSPTYVAYWRK